MSKEIQQSGEVVHLSKSRRKPSYDWRLEGHILGIVMTCGDHAEARRMLAELRPLDFHNRKYRELHQLLTDLAVDAAPDFGLVGAAFAEREDLTITLAEVSQLAGSAPMPSMFDGYLKKLREVTERRATVLRIAEAEERISMDDAAGALGVIAESVDTRTPTDLDTATEGYAGVIDKMDVMGEKDPRPVGALANVEIAFRYDPRLSSFVWLDEWTNTIMVHERGSDRPLTDEDVGRVALYLGRAYRLHVRPHVVAPVINVAAKRRGRNPLVEYLDGLVWDGVPRIDTWLERVFGCVESPEHPHIYRDIGRRWLIQAVARALDPGCKADTVLVLKGEQGIRKSTVLKMLAGGPPYFADTPLRIGNTKSYLAMGRVWIYELAEGESLRKSDANEAKAFLSSPDDTFVPPYGRFAITVKRHVVFATTINDEAFLSDDTGSRRYWPVECVRVDLAWVREHRDQLWAEAVVRYRRAAAAEAAGTGASVEDRWWFTREEDVALEAHNEQYKHDDPWIDMIAKWAKENMGLTRATTATVGTDALKMHAKDLTRSVEMRIGGVLSRLGWKRRKTKVDGRAAWCYHRPEMSAVKPHSQPPSVPTWADEHNEDRGPLF